MILLKGKQRGSPDFPPFLLSDRETTMNEMMTLTILFLLFSFPAEGAIRTLNGTFTNYDPFFSEYQYNIVIISSPSLRSTLLDSSTLLYFHFHALLNIKSTKQIGRLEKIIFVEGTKCTPEGSSLPPSEKPLVALVSLEEAKEHSCLVKQSLSSLTLVVEAATSADLVVYGDSRNTLEAHDYSRTSGSLHVPFTTVTFSVYSDLIELLSQGNGTGGISANISAQTNPFQPVYQSPGFLAYRVIFILAFVCLLGWIWYSLYQFLMTHEHHPTHPFFFLCFFSTVACIGRIIYLASGATYFYLFGAIAAIVGYGCLIYAQASYLFLWIEVVGSARSGSTKYFVKISHILIFVLCPLLLIGVIFRILEFCVGYPYSTELGFIFFISSGIGYILFLFICAVCFAMVTKILKGSELNKRKEAVIRKFQTLGLMLGILLLAGIAAHFVGIRYNRASVSSAVGREVLSASVQVLFLLFFAYSISVSSSGTGTEHRSDTSMRTKNPLETVTSE